MTNDTIKKANEELAVSETEPQSLEEFLSYVEDNPSAASHSVKYILEAIESCGTRTVVENGEELERYKFFDDPYGDGEHAILGNTEVLNSFVDELRRMVSEEGENNRIIWFNGPTATGKSELKRCLINGVSGYSKTEEGERYTVEWNITDNSSQRGIAYGDSISSTDWYESPVNTNPLSVLPEQTREDFIEDINEDTEHPVVVNADIDPFSQEVFNYLKREHAGSEEIFEELTDEERLRVVRHQMEVGDGIGILHAEDSGSIKERLVGSWMPQMMKQFQSRGRKNPQAFAYDGVLSQGNGGITIVEDARQHVDAVQNLLNIPEEGVVKLDQKIPMEIDTLLVLVSNPDLKSELEQFSDEGSFDPLRALRRRLDEFEVKYLTSPTLEAQLIKRLLVNDYTVLDCDFEERMEKAVEPVSLYDSRFGPRAIEAAAMYDVVTRLDDDYRGNVEQYEKAIGLDRGYLVEDSGSTVEYSELNIDSSIDGREGMPVTFTIDTLTELSQEDDSILPEDVIEKMKDNIMSSSIFSENEAGLYHQQNNIIQEYIEQKQEDDVLSAMLEDKEPSREDIEEYVDGIFEWDKDDEEDAEYDPYYLREFEMEHIGPSEDDYGEDAKPNKIVREFREQRIINPVNSFIYNSKEDGNFSVAEVAISECEELSHLLSDQDWLDVERYYENVDFAQWNRPTSDTETEELKEKTITNMCESVGYTEEEAKIVSNKIVKRYGTAQESAKTLKDIIEKLGEE